MPNGNWNLERLDDRLRDLELGQQEIRGDLRTMKIIGVAFVVLVELSLPVIWQISQHGF